MLIEDFKMKSGLDDMKYNNLIKKFGLENRTEIDDILANNILQRVIIEKKYKNGSSLSGVFIEGVFGKYNYRLDFKDSINIFVAENGHGKTTLIKIIVAALTNDTELLSNLPFRKITINFNNGKELCVESTNPMLYGKRNNSKHFNANLDISDFYVDFEKIMNLVPHRIPRGLRTVRQRILRNNAIESIIPMSELYQQLELQRDRGLLSLRELDEVINFIIEKDLLYDERFKDISNNLSEKVKYLPTFRRVEAELKDIYNFDSDIEDSLRNSSLKFGLKDVEMRIERLTSRLTKEAFETHSKINGEILSDLLNNTPLIITQKQREEITTEKVEIIIGRIGKDKVKASDQLKGFLTKERGTDKVENEEFLEYYLYKLIRIYDSQKEIDNKIKLFKDVCNKYLINKELIYDEVSPKVRILDKEDGSSITFSELSSGEKQILSIFSELYLEVNEQLIYIIDEPELSLSIVWQKKLLQDIYDSGKVKLLIATTHSPFIYKNNFSAFAKDLNKFKQRITIND